MSGVGHEDIVIHEGLRVQEETAAERFRRESLKFLYHCWQVGRLTLVLIPILGLSALLLDLPLRMYDGLVGGDPAFVASNWLSQGEGLLVLSMFFLVLVTRSYGPDFAIRVQSVSWIVTASLASILLIYLAPELTGDDWPGGRFAAGFLISWFVGQIFAVHFYDLMRGGKWWRAPLYGLLVGFAVQAAIYFPVVYWDAGVPWISWMVIDFCLKAFLSVLFLGLYWMLRRPLRPYLGHGGY